MTVIGTVGHIDHGKTALLSALTGVDADRLPEERRRGMTIDIGYAYMKSMDGTSIDFVDLPGHHDLTGNLLVGVGEIDAAMLVIAGDEGPQEQTFEHLDILAGFGVSRGIAVVTKLDLLDGGEREDALATAAQLVDASALRGSPVLVVSARTGEGMDELRSALEELQRRVRQAGAPGGASARLAIDRVFRSTGHGLIVTGTLRGAGIAMGDQVRIEPGGGTARVRQIQVHGHPASSVEAGGRVALNLASTDRVHARRGSVVIRGSTTAASSRLIVAARLLAPRNRAAERQVLVHVGTDRVTATLRWLRDPPDPDPSRETPGLALLTMSDPVASALMDPLVIRVPSPSQLYAGGFVIDPMPPDIGTRTMRGRLTEAIPAAGDASDLLAFLLGYRRAMSVDEFVAVASGAGIIDALGTAPAARFGPLLVHGDAESKLRQAALDLDANATLESVRGRVARMLRRYGGLAPDVVRRGAVSLVEMLFEEGRLDSVGDLVFDAMTNEAESSRLRQAEAVLLDSLTSTHPPRLSEAATAAGLPMAAVKGLVSSGRVVRLAPDLGYASQTYAHLVRRAVEMARSGELSAGAFRDAVGTSRRNAVVLLDSMSTAGFIRREGSGHVLGPRAVDLSPDTST